MVREAKRSALRAVVGAGGTYSDSRRSAPAPGALSRPRRIAARILVWEDCFPCHRSVLGSAYASSLCARHSSLLCSLASRPAAQEEPIPVFGTTVVISSGLRGLVYHIHHNRTHLPDFEKLKPAGPRHLHVFSQLAATRLQARLSRRHQSHRMVRDRLHRKVLDRRSRFYTVFTAVRRWREALHRRSSGHRQ